MKLAREPFVPQYVFNTTVQQPDTAGRLDVTTLAWDSIIEKGKRFKVAAIADEHVAEFLKGESERGQTSVQLSKMADSMRSKSLVKAWAASCQYGKLRGDKKQQQKERSTGGMGIRRSKLATHTSIKKGCQYRFTVKVYVKRPGIAIIKFPDTEHKAGGLCHSMQHVNEDLQPVHAGCTTHVGHTAEVRECIRGHIKSGRKPAAVLAGAFPLLLNACHPLPASHLHFEVVQQATWSCCI